MAQSTGIVLAAGALTLADSVLSGLDTRKAVFIVAGTVGTAYVAAGLDKVLPGFGTGTAVLLLVAALYSHGPSISQKLNLTAVSHREPDNDPQPGKTV